MTTKPTSIEIRAYQVGFGDCFLMSFVYAKGKPRHVLIDFGTTALPKRGRNGMKPSVHMPVIAADIKKVSGGELAAVVATHRHADHISGFATDGTSGGSGKIIAECKPKVVVQPWTEDPDAPKNAHSATQDSSRSKKSFVAGLAAMNRLAREISMFALSPPRSMSASVAKQLHFLGMDNISNRSAVENLRAMGERRGATAVWAHHGSNAELGRLLPGVKVHVLGPPDLTQTESIRKMRSSDPDEFWQLLSGPRSLQGMGLTRSAKSAKSGARRSLPVPAEARWFRDRLGSLSSRQLLEIVRVLDDQMNNTSLILLFEVGGKKLLFPGDAQIENWSYALQDAKDAHRTRALLQGVDVYKVGHHGSRNATPKELLWKGFKKRSKSKGRMISLLSTLPGKHGTPGRKTEVPRKTLLQALEDETDLRNTNKLKGGAKPELCHKVVIRT